MIMADLYNEPHRAGWGTGERGTDWRSAATRLGNHVLNLCPRWLIAVQGIGHGPECVEAIGSSCWWGENLLGQRRQPVVLRVADRLVLSPHLYGHDPTRAYMQAVDFPLNMPRCGLRRPTAPLAKIYGIR